MSGRDWQWPLENGEILLWQGRPAPRCFTFRNWKLAAVGTLLFFASSFWLMLAYELITTSAYPWWLLLIPVPLVLLSLLLGPIALLLARFRWEKVFYALTDGRLLVRDGLFAARIVVFPVTDFVAWRLKSYGSQLVSIKLELQSQQSVVLHCLEQPQNLLRHLQRDIDTPGSLSGAGDSV